MRAVVVIGALLLLFFSAAMPKMPRPGTLAIRELIPRLPGFTESYPKLGTEAQEFV